MIKYKCGIQLYFVLIGATRSHIDAFKRVRDARIDRYVVETNKVLIRLDKLISPDAPSDPGKRKGKIPTQYGKKTSNHFIYFKANFLDALLLLVKADNFWLENTG